MGRRQLATVLVTALAVAACTDGAGMTTTPASTTTSQPRSRSPTPSRCGPRAAPFPPSRNRARPCTRSPWSPRLTELWGPATEEGWRIDDSSDMMTALTLVGMQGLINRTGPRVFLDWEADNYIPDVAHHWREQIDLYYPLTELDLDGGEAIAFLLDES